MKKRKKLSCVNYFYLGKFNQFFLGKNCSNEYLVTTFLSRERQGIENLGSLQLTRWLFGNFEAGLAGNKLFKQEGVMHVYEESVMRIRNS
ncbi:hypothetical protein BpHYR1_030494 [Brachionus plicatilis]|uniref:Uncharacterized protein n=1 Tax=Brachionus plicatilis TaxID=10195 RepID=A0A3M7R8Y6_BRAPC|nr:hypothetical protein BpHYR1_030494 [Brachionus plicatilis]